MNHASTFKAELCEKLAALLKLLREDKLVSYNEYTMYERIGVIVDQTDYVVEFTVLDEDTRLPVKVTITTPIKKETNG
jgi:hypothetical protein